MSYTTTPCSLPRQPDRAGESDAPSSTGQQLIALGCEINANQYRLVHLAARYDEELEWYHHGHKSAASWISAELGIHSSTAREWIRVGHALRHLPSIDAAFAGNALSYAKVRILTRWADPHNEAELLTLAHERSADRLTTAIAKALAEGDETDDERDARLHESRSVTSWTDGDGLTVIRIALPPTIGKPILAAVDEMVRRIADTPIDSPGDASADAFDRQTVVADPTQRHQHAPADAFDQQRVASSHTQRAHEDDELPRTLVELRRRWQPTGTEEWHIPTLAQQRADALSALFLRRDIELATEIVIHVRGDGVTFDDGTPTTSSAVVRQLDDAFVRLMVHDTERRPINASHRRRLPTAAQRRVVLEAHGHECVDCQSTDLLELDHNPPFHQTRHTVTDELEPRCGPCHRARHRFDGPSIRRKAA